MFDYVLFHTFMKGTHALAWPSEEDGSLRRNTVLNYICKYFSVIRQRIAIIIAFCLKSNLTVCFSLEIHGCTSRKLKQGFIEGGWDTIIPFIQSHYQYVGKKQKLHLGVCVGKSVLLFLVRKYIH